MNPEIGDTARDGALGSPPLRQSALIHIGANAISMVVVETDESSGELEIMDLLEQPLPLAEDIFNDGVISRGTIERCVKVLRRFETTLDEYGLQGAEDVHAVATNILLESDNSELLLNRLQVACGVDVRPLDEGDMTRLLYLSVAKVLRKHPELRKACVLVVHVGPGNTRLMLFKRGRIAQYNSYRMGASRVAEAIERMSPDSDALLSLIKGHVNGTIEQIVDAYADESIDEILAIGQEIQAAAHPMEGKDGQLIKADRKALRRAAKALVVAEPSKIVTDYELNAHAARSLLAGLVCNLAVLGKFGMPHLYVAKGRFEERFLMGMVGPEISAKRFVSEVIGSAKALARKYQADPQHGKHVASLSVALFDQLAELTNLPIQDRLLLEVAGIVHEVGSFISRRSHHKHSLYIVKNSEIFGLNDEETTLVALIARYHRHALPQPFHPYLSDLSRDARIRVSKLAALLRVADALDRSHTQHLHIQKVEIVKDQCRLHLGQVVNVSVEELALRTKADLFEQVFGLEIVLVTG